MLAFDATTGRRIVSTDQLNELKTRKNSFSSFQWLGEEPVDTKISEGLKEEYNNIVPVISGDDWTDYRPARPEDFVGRKKILSNIFEFWENVNRGSSNTRLFSIKAPSGMGKSSVVLKAVSIASNNRKYSKKFFVFAEPSVGKIRLSHRKRKQREFAYDSRRVYRPDHGHEKNALPRFLRHSPQRG